MIHAGAKGTIWIGAANKLSARTAWCKDAPGLKDAIEVLETWQTPQKMRVVFDALKRNPQVRWKDSYQKALGVNDHGQPMKDKS